MPDNKPLVSIIMPSLNVKKYIDECMISVLNQTLKQIEVLCIDAGSTDGTYERLKEYEKNDQRVHVVKSDKKSYGYQVNLGIKKAAAKYIGIVETDDYIDKQMFEILYQRVIKNNLDYVKCDFTFFRDMDGFYAYNSGKLFDENTSGFYNQIIQPLDCTYLYFHDFNVWKAIYNKKFLVKNAIMFNESAGAAFQDIGFQQLLLYYAKRCMYIPEKLYYYRYGHMVNSSVNPRLLQFVKQEFTRLLDEELQNCTGRKMELIYQKMGLDLWSQYNVLLDLYEKKIENDEVEQSYQEIRDRLIYALNQGIIKEIDMEDNIWKQILLLLDNKEKYTNDYLLYRQIKIDKEKCKMGEHNVIWGCGTYGMQALEFMKKYGYDCVALTDNNKALWGKRINGIEVREPANIFSDNKQLTYIVANKYYAKEIVMQLRENGISEEKIVLWKQ